MPSEEIPRPDVSAVVTEDDTPVDNFPSEKEQRLLTESLYSSWNGPKAVEDEGRRPFLAAANVGVFSVASQPPLVPDVLLSIDVTLHPDWWKKENRSYFIWEIGKTPDVVIEIVSNREGHELDVKLRRYALMRIPYYVVWDPVGYYEGSGLYAFELQGLQYVPMDRPWFDHVGLGLKEWEGTYEGQHARWIRWHTADGALVPTGAERANAERTRAEAEHNRAEAEHNRAEAERTRAEAERTRAEAERERASRLEARLRALGVNPDEI